jgi:hypothetical protein
VTPRTVRRAAAAALLVAVSCNVYDPSLFGVGGTGSNGGGTSGGSGGSGTSGTGDGDGDDAGAGNSGVGGTQTNGGTSGSDAGGSLGMAGDPGMAGAPGEAGAGGDPGTAGTGGSAGGTAGSGGKGGTAGSGGTTGGTGGGGTAGSGGTGGSTSVQGCAKLSVPLDATGDKAHFVITLPNPIDMSVTASPSTISVHYYVDAGKGGSIFPYVQDSSFKFLGPAQAAWTPLTTSTAWKSVTWNVTAADAGSSGIAKNQIKRLGIEVNAAPTTSGWISPTVVYIDSVTVNTPASSFTFDTTDKVYVTPTTTEQSGLIWQNSNSSDTSAAGTTLSWVDTCP